MNRAVSCIPNHRKAAIITQNRFGDWNEQMNQLPRKVLLVLCTFALFAAGMIALPYVWPFAAAFLLSRILEPFVLFASKGSSRIRLSRPLATAVGMVVLFGLAGALFGALIRWLFGELSGFLRSLPQLFEWLNTHAFPSLMKLYNRWRILLPDDVPRLMESALSQIGQNVLRWTASLSGWITSGAWNTATSIPHALLSAVLLVTGTYYLTADRERIAAFWRRTFPPSLTQRGQLIRASLFKALLGQLRSQLTVSVVVMFFLMIMLGIAGVRYGVIIGMLIGIADALPIFGAGVFLIPWALVSLLTGQTGMGILLSVLYAGALIIRQILEPRLVGRHLGLYPLATMMAIYAGYRLMGFIGILGGPVLLTLAKAVLEADATSRMSAS